ncbi:MAG: serine/threonine-protein kinase, partial [Cyanobacteria bacterium J06650_10]
MSKPTLLNNRYRILKAIGEGKYDNTFIGEDTRHPAKQRCVVKQLKPRLYNAQTEPQLKENILREAKALAAIGSSHSQIPTLQAYFAEQGLFYLIYDWTEGTLLSQVKNLPWPEAKVSSFVVSLLGALAHLHKNNLIHQNLNPDNIIIRQQDQQPHLIYFGAVKALVNRAGLNPAKTGASVIVKTRGFMSPEQAMGRAIPSSNLYSLGMTAIYLLTGQSPLRIPTDKHNGRLLWRQLAPTVGDRTAGIFTRAIHTNPAIRFANA